MSYATVADLRAYLPQVPAYGQQRITPSRRDRAVIMRASTPV